MWVSPPSQQIDEAYEIIRWISKSNTWSATVTWICYIDILVFNLICVTARKGSPGKRAHHLLASAPALLTIFSSRWYSATSQTWLLSLENSISKHQGAVRYAELHQSANWCKHCTTSNMILLTHPDISDQEYQSHSNQNTMFFPTGSCLRIPMFDHYDIYGYNATK